MELREAIETRASCRRFSAKPVGKDVIEEVIRAGIRAPSPLNQQPWAFSVLLGPAAKKRLHDVAAESKAKLFADTGKTWVNKYDLSFLENAPALVVVLADSTKIGMGDYLGDRLAHVKAASACVANMLLAATGLGLGSVWFTMYDSGKVREALGIESNWDVVGILPLGYPADPLQPTPRTDAGAKITYVE
jgi:nitroreductase